MKLAIVSSGMLIADFDGHGVTRHRVIIRRTTRNAPATTIANANKHKAPNAHSPREDRNLVVLPVHINSGMLIADFDVIVLKRVEGFAD